MKQKILILTFLMLFLLGTMNCFGFCVYNKTDQTSINADQISGGGIFTSFSQIVYKGKRECCSWKDNGCNKKGKKDSIVKLRISYPRLTNEGVVTWEICEKSIKAYQSLIVTGKKGHYKCKLK